jgi:precorrin-6A synthase
VPGAGVAAPLADRASWVGTCTRPASNAITGREGGVREVLIVGIGAGNPNHMTMEAVGALNSAHVIFIPDKGAEKGELRRVREEICSRFVTRTDVRYVAFETLRRQPEPDDYQGAVEAWHDAIAAQYTDLLLQELRDGETGAFLVWGDPGLYDSTLRIIEAVRARGAFALDYRVVPGITSVQALAARHRIPLNRIGQPVHITTGRQLREGFPDGADTVVVMLDGAQSFAQLDRDDLDIVWGANLGLPSERLVSGRLAEVSRDIERLRAEARHEAGWVMDTYVLRTRHDP